MNVNFEPVGQGAQQLDFDGQADERRHAAVGDGGCELDAHCALGVTDLDSDLLHNVELLQRQGMLWVIDGSDQMCLKLRMILIYSSSVLAETGKSLLE